MKDDTRKVQLHLKHGDHMLSLRADTVAELSALISEAEKATSLGVFFGNPTPAPVAASSTDASNEESAPAPPVSLAEAEAKVAEHLGPGEELASEALINVASTKTGKTVEELQGISKTEAQRLIKEGK
jgi:hypothetical protein